MLLGGAIVGFYYESIAGLYIENRNLDPEEVKVIPTGMWIRLFGLGKGAAIVLAGLSSLAVCAAVLGLTAGIPALFASAFLKQFVGLEVAWVLGVLIALYLAYLTFRHA